MSTSSGITDRQARMIQGAIVVVILLGLGLLWYVPHAKAAARHQRWDDRATAQLSLQRMSEDLGYPESMTQIGEEETNICREQSQGLTRTEFLDDKRPLLWGTGYHAQWMRFVTAQWDYAATYGTDGCNTL